MISKELLSEVLKTPIVKIQKADSTLLAFWDIYSARHSLINIHELEHKCKEWALREGYQFKVYFQTDGTEEWQVGEYGFGWYGCRAKNCIDACEWLLKNA